MEGPPDASVASSLGSACELLVRGEVDAAVALLDPLVESGDAAAMRVKAYVLERSDVTAAYHMYVRSRVALDNGGAFDAAAVELFRRRADLEDAGALFNLGYLHAHGIGVEADAGRAKDCYLRAVLQGHASALNSLGFCYDDGRGVNENAIAANELYHKAALVGHPGAMHNLGLNYREGRGVAKDLEQAKTFFTKAAGVGVACSMSCLGMMLCAERRFEEARAWFERATAGDPTAEHARCQANALFCLGDFWRRGLVGGGVKDLVRARALLERAAAFGSWRAMQALSEMETDPEAARRWREQAEANGCPKASSWTCGVQ